ncbi:GNAT family N-acetyltransferase [Vibrio nitrifigilis]|uniref:GNAT family N-acetyltransferase n=1 Tax=Vibrio nitrifigilis TaxID=2789781 RepID=A0ABS0GJD3_9VIBR|nr:GNAT family N-acetyltransferase [Vibrio nitrifigilis]MBF9002527.1 GNAT family N-acetyltransferase [Vibrio nitrifigilis]
MSLSITLATMQDVTAIHSLTSQLGYHADQEQSRQWLHQMLHSDSHAVFVAKRDELTLGWVAVEKRLFLESGFKAEITGLVVADVERRAGIGRALVEQAKEWATVHGLTELVVRSNISREHSHLFYQRIGFHHQKTAHQYQMELPVLPF